jgi:hypothetical protein
MRKMARPHNEGELPAWRTDEPREDHDQATYRRRLESFTAAWGSETRCRLTWAIGGMLVNRPRLNTMDFGQLPSSRVNQPIVNDHDLRQPGDELSVGLGRGFARCRSSVMGPWSRILTYQAMSQPASKLRLNGDDFSGGERKPEASAASDARRKDMLTNLVA